MSEPRTSDALICEARSSGAEGHDGGLRGAPVAAGLLFGGDEVEGFADGLGGLSPLEQGLCGEAGGLDGGAGSGGVDAGFFDCPRNLIVLFGAGVDEGLHGPAGEVRAFDFSRVVGGEVGDDG